MGTGSGDRNESEESDESELLHCLVWYEYIFYINQINFYINNSDSISYLLHYVSTVLTKLKDLIIEKSKSKDQQI